VSQEITQPFGRKNAALIPEAPATISHFWDSFRLFPSAFDESGFTYWYAYVFGLMLFALSPLLLYLYTRSSSKEFQFYTENKLTIILLPVTMIVVVTTYNYWKNHLPAMFQELEARERLHGKTVAGVSDQPASDAQFTRDYQAFLMDYQMALLNRQRYILIVGFVLACIGLFVPLVYRYISSPVSPLLIAVLPVPIFLGYFLGASAWTLFVTGNYLGRLSQRFEIEVEPWHPDGCGGLRIVGNFCLRMALPILAGVTFFGIYGIGTFFLPGLLPQEQQALQIGANLGLLIFDIPLVALAFFHPLLGIHAEMLRKKKVYEEQFAGHLKRLYTRLWPAFEQGDLAEIKKIGEEIEIAHKMHPLVVDYPSWPFNRRILFTYLLPQIFPLISAALPIVSTLLPLLKK
jgi:hypothetical protein